MRGPGRPSDQTSDNETKGHYIPPNMIHIGHKTIYTALLPKCLMLK